jgi:hypothetical protein
VVISTALGHAHQEDKDVMATKRRKTSPIIEYFERDTKHG